MKEDSKYITERIDLSQIIPFESNLSGDKLILSKGIMTSDINLDYLKLDLKKHFPTIESLEFKLHDKSVMLEILTDNTLNIADVNSTLQAIISTELPRNLFNSATHKPLIFIPNDYFGFPLLGSLYIGIIDRGTNLLQVRSITGCPLNCPFCSVDEGPTSKTKLRDFIVDTDYLVNSYNYVVDQKQLNSVEAHLDGQGEPMSYPYLVELVQKLWENEKTTVVSLQTDGWFLSEKIIDELADAKLTRINLSVNAFDSSLAKTLAGRGDYNLERIKRLIEYIINSGISLLLTPIWLSGMNDQDIEEIIKFSKKINSKEKKYPTLGIQNYLYHNEGRNMPSIEQISFKEFYRKLRLLEKKYDISDLILKEHMFNTYKTDFLPLPMKKNEIVSAEIVFPGRLKNEYLAKAKQRIIHISNGTNLSIGKKYKVRIIRNRHNIFFGVLI